MPKSVNTNIVIHLLMFYVKCIRQARTQNANTSPCGLVFVFCVRMTQYAARLPDLGERENEENEKRANICKTTRRLFGNSSGAVGHAPFTISG